MNEEHSPITEIINSTEITTNTNITDIREYSKDISNDESQFNADCLLCKYSTQHTCNNCGKPVCNFCTMKDPNSSNE